MTISLKLHYKLHNTLHCAALSFAVAVSACALGEADLDLESDSDEIELTPDTGEPTEDVKLCFRVANRFLTTGGDFPNGTVNYIARGISFVIFDAAGNPTTHKAGNTSGCKTVELNSFATYTVRMLSEGKLANGNSFKVMKDDTDMLRFGWTSSSTVRPALMVVGPDGAKTKEFIWPTVPGGTYTNDISTVLSAVYRTLNIHALTMNKFYRIYLSGGSGANFGFDSEDQPAVFIDALSASGTPATLRRKFVISHELSHLGLYLRLGDRIGSDGGNKLKPGLKDTRKTSWCANGDTHTPGSALLPFGSEEWGNSAFNEGWAQYVSASTWNRRNDTDCEYRGFNAWNNCYDPGAAFDACYTARGLEHKKKTGFERDWLTTFWAIERIDGCGIDFDTIVDIVIGANPLQWKHDDAPAAIRAEAATYLSGSDLSCFRNALDTRIKF